VNLANATPQMAERYLGSAPRALYLIRPDQHVAARWESADADTIRAAHARALGKTVKEEA
jgi:3-(3-hydroxy-phenyl)propionate hydroxylase